jgi:RNA polymerase sigma factor (sigma-70 family)
MVIDIEGERVRSGITAQRDVKIRRHESPPETTSPCGHAVPPHNPLSGRPAHFQRLLNILRRKGRSHEDAEDLIQEAMLRLHRYRVKAARSDSSPAIAAALPIQNEEAFLTRAVQNLSIDLHRSRRPDIRREVPFDYYNARNPLVDHRTPEQVLDTQQRLAFIQRRLDAVNVRTREVYFAHRAGYSYDEIGAHFDLTHITIRRHIARALPIIMENDPRN